MAAGPASHRCRELRRHRRASCVSAQRRLSPREGRPAGVTHRDPLRLCLYLLRVSTVVQVDKLRKSTLDFLFQKGHYARYKQNACSKTQVP